MPRLVGKILAALLETPPTNRTRGLRRSNPEIDPQPRRQTRGTRSAPVCRRALSPRAVVRNWGRTTGPRPSVVARRVEQTIEVLDELLEQSLPPADTAIPRIRSEAWDSGLPRPGNSAIIPSSGRGSDWPEHWLSSCHQGPKFEPSRWGNRSNRLAWSRPQTKTVYGLGSDALDPHAADRLRWSWIDLTRVVIDTQSVNR